MKAVLSPGISGKDVAPTAGMEEPGDCPVPSRTYGVCPAQAVLGAGCQALLCLEEVRSFQPCNIYEFHFFFFFFGLEL